MGKDIVYKTRMCTICHGQGCFLAEHHQTFVTCLLCNGTGWLIYNAECACGRPIKEFSDDQLGFCGLKECLADLRQDKRDAERPATNFFPIHSQWPRDERYGYMNGWEGD